MQFAYQILLGSTIKQLSTLNSTEAAPLTGIPLKFDFAKMYRFLFVVEKPLRPAVDTEALISQSLQLHAKVSLAIISWCYKLRVAQIHMRLDQFTCAIRAVELPVSACLCSTCSEVTEVGGLQVL